NISYTYIYTHTVVRAAFSPAVVRLRLLMAGVLILFATIATAFLGYVLVITNLLSAIPYIGTILVQGFAVDNATLTRFFALHLLIPLAIAALAIVHLLFLHRTGSNNPLGLKSFLWIPELSRGLSYQLLTSRAHYD
ncbi:hypothetical protein B7P43_G01522, partial [Cryptotermes secundus]